MHPPGLTITLVRTWLVMLQQNGQADTSTHNRSPLQVRSGQLGSGNSAGKQSTGKNLPEVRILLLLREASQAGLCWSSGCLSRQVVSQIVLAQQLGEKTSEMLGAAESLLIDLHGMARFRSRAQAHSWGET